MLSLSFKAGLGTASLAVLGASVIVMTSCATGDEGTRAAHSGLVDCADISQWTVGAYLGGDRVQNLGSAYECKPWPFSGWCGLAGYEPGASLYWQDAWTLVDQCGTPDQGGEGGSGGDPMEAGSLACDTEECCPAGTTPIVYDNSPNAVNSTQAGACLVMLGGPDQVQATGQGMAVLGGDGDENIQAGPGAQVRGGAGRDVINGFSNATVLGNSGDDTIMAANGTNFVYPGAGVDTVAAGTGADTIAIYDLCEVSYGDSADAGSGVDTLITPVPVEQLQALGYTLSNFEEIRVEQNSCKSDCVAKPDCSGHGVCAEGDAPGQVRCQCDTGFSGENCENNLTIQPLGQLACLRGAAADVPVDPGHMDPGHEICSPGLTLVSQLDGIEATTTLQYRTTPESPKQCIAIYRECDADGQELGQPATEVLNLPPDIDQVCQGAPEVAACCGVDESTIVWDDEFGVCQSDADCLLFGKICTRLCFEANCTGSTDCLDPSCPPDGTVEFRCAAPNLSCPAIPTEGPCEERRECPEDNASGSSDPASNTQSNVDDPPADVPSHVEVADTRPTEYPPSAACSGSSTPPINVALVPEADDRDMVVGNDKWGVFANANINFNGSAVPQQLGQARLDVQGSAGVDIGVRVWGNDVSVFKAGANAQLTTCGGRISREAKLFGFDIDPGFGNELPMVSSTACEEALGSRSLSSVRDAMHRALDAKRYADCLGPVTAANEANYVQLCIQSLTSLSQLASAGYTAPVSCVGIPVAECTALKTQYCSTPIAQASIPEEWLALYRAHRDAIAASVADVFAQQQALIGALPPSRLPIIDRHDSFTAFHVEFEYPVGPVSVIIEIELAGGWGVSGELQTEYGVDPVTAKINAVLTPSVDVTALAFAGIGLGPVAVGIGGELVLIDLQTPLTTGISVYQAHESDPRPRLLGLPYAFDFGPRWSHWTADWTFGAGARAEFLSGRLDLQARVRLLFFKKTFRKVIAEWSGIPLTYSFTGAITTDADGNSGLVPEADDADAGWFHEPVYYIDPDAIAATTLSQPGETCMEPDLGECVAPPK